MLILEYRFEYLTTFLDAPTLEHSYIKLEQAIPCIMHYKNCAGERILYMLILVGLDQRHPLVQHDSLIVSVKLLINNHVLGDDNDLYLYKFHMKMVSWEMSKSTTGT